MRSCVGGKKAELTRELLLDVNGYFGHRRDPDVLLAASQVVQKLAEIHAADGQVAFVDPVEGHDPPATLSGGQLSQADQEGAGLPFDIPGRQAVQVAEVGIVGQLAAGAAGREQARHQRNVRETVEASAEAGLIAGIGERGGFLGGEGARNAPLGFLQVLLQVSQGHLQQVRRPIHGDVEGAGVRERVVAHLMAGPGGGQPGLELLTPGAGGVFILVAARVEVKGAAHAAAVQLWHDCFQMGGHTVVEGERERSGVGRGPKGHG